MYKNKFPNYSTRHEWQNDTLFNYSFPCYNTDKSFKKMFPFKINKNEVTNFNLFEQNFTLDNYFIDLKK